MVVYSPTTPAAISPLIIAFCRGLVANPEPRFMRVEPVDGVAANDCFPAVNAQVEAHGGSTRHGWRIWEWPGIFLEAEFHAVWELPEGSLRDITPCPVARVLFLPDPTRVYQGRQVNNIRQAISKHPAVGEFIRAADARFELMNRGDRAEQHGRVVLRGREAEELEAIQARMADAQLAIIDTLPRPGRNDRCPCGSGRKYKRCHGG